MENLLLEETSRTPYINFNAQSGVLKISGSSIPEDTLSFYREIFAWVEEYAAAHAAVTTVEVKLDYFNTSSSKCLYTIFKKLENIKVGQVEVNWYYSLSDTDMFESGQDFLNLVKVPFKIIRLTKEE